MPQYEKPKIFLIGTEPNLKVELDQSGLNTSEGSFGQPYAVTKSDSYSPVCGTYSLPNLADQELVVIDLASREVVAQSARDERAVLYGNYVVSACRYGVVDPRPVFAMTFAKTFDRIMEIGGIFVIFAAASIPQEFRVHEGYQTTGITKPTACRIWSFLSVFATATINAESGREMIVQGDSAFATLLASYLPDGSYECIFPSSQRIDERREVLAVNKFGDPVALLIEGFEESNRGAPAKGMAIVVPQLKDKAGFLKRLISEVLPGESPQFFSGFIADRWLTNPHYQLRSVLELEEEKERIVRRADEEIGKISFAIQEKRQQYSWLSALLTGTGKDLVDAVKTALSTVGFGQIVDVDVEQDGRGLSRREDLQIKDGSPVIIVDVKGVSGLPRDADIQQPSKHALMRMREWNRTDVVSLFIVNHERNLSPQQRSQNPFRNEMVSNAHEVGIGLLSTWTLFRLLLGFIDNGWRSGQVKPLFYKSGIIEPLPVNYSRLGQLTESFAKALIVKLEAPLKVGNRIAFEFENRMTEGEVKSLQLNSADVAAVQAGEEVGVEVEPSHPKLKEGVPIYLDDAMPEATE